MKRLRLARWSGQLMSAQARPAVCLRQQQLRALERMACRRMYSASTAIDVTYEDGEEGESADSTVQKIPTPAQRREELPSPLPEAALRSPKLAALHARLALPKSLPVQTLARTLVDPSADNDQNFNNASLAHLGGSLISYYVSEFLMATYPRLPMAVLYAAAFAYNGNPTLHIIGKEWGVDTAAAPGGEVDPGLLQFSKLSPGASPHTGIMHSTRPDKKSWIRRGMSSRVVYDDEFGDVIRKNDPAAQQTAEMAYSSFIRAVIGAIYAHAGQQAAKTFIQQHILSRHLDVSTLFRFENPVRELARLCMREEFEQPQARIISETGRHSISPVFVVGIFSGTEKLGEGQGPSLKDARIRAAVAALKAWYMYSPGKNVRMPSETDLPNAKPWVPLHIDIGEIIH